MDNIAKYIDEEKDVAYLVGQEKARKQEKFLFVSNLLQKLNLTKEQIADIAGTSVDFVLGVEQQLATKS